MAIWNPFSRKKESAAAATERSGGEGPSSPAASREQRATAADATAADATASQAPAEEPAAAAAAAIADRRAGETADETADQGADEGARPRKGIFARLKQALAKTYEVLNTDIRDLVGKEGRVVDEAFVAELFPQLVKTDMGQGPAREICDQLLARFRARKVTMEQLVDSAKTTIRQLMQQDSAEVNLAPQGTTVIMVCGVNGSGKTTSIAKLAYRFVHEGRSVVLGAGDTFRAAAVEQLTIWAERLGVEIITGKSGSDPASVAFRAVDAAVKNGRDICIIDTAGRLQTQANLMDELGKIRRVIGRVLPDAPHEVLLVLDATAGQNGISQARGFSQAAGCTGIVLAKLDGTAKGGVAIPIRREFGLPVKLVGLGETADALAPFDVDRYVDALFDAQASRAAAR